MASLGNSNHSHWKIYVSQCAWVTELFYKNCMIDMHDEVMSSFTILDASSLANIYSWPLAIATYKLPIEYESLSLDCA